MEYFRIKTVSEEDVDRVVDSAGGQRIREEGSADYLFKGAIMDLKLIQEEGFDKSTRQAKIASLFRITSPQSPVVVVNPNRLPHEDQRAYYNIVSGPIKTHIKKAAHQLDVTRRRYPGDSTRVLLILNVGYTALAPEEFSSVCLK